MMTIASFIRTVARQTLQWTALAGTTLVLGQTALAEDTVSVLMKQRLADMTGKEATVIDRGLCARRRIRPARPSRLSVRLRLGGSRGLSIRGREARDLYKRSELV